MKTRIFGVRRSVNKPVVAIWLMALLFSIQADEPCPSTNARRVLDIQSFEYVWQTIRDRHYDPTFGGLDWQAVHDELRPKLECAPTTDAARQVIKGMIRRLELSHFSIIPSDLYVKLQSSGADNLRGITGIKVRAINGRALVTHVEKGSSAKRGRFPVRVRQLPIPQR